MSDCWICKQKAEYKLEKLNAARLAAKQQANEQGQTMAIIQEGFNYRVVRASEASGTILEYLSKHN